MDGDGIIDLAIGGSVNDNGGINRGAVHVVLLNAAGTVKSSLTISSERNGGPPLPNHRYFGTAVAGVGDLNGDGVPDLMVCSRYRSASVLFLNANGSAKTSIPLESEQLAGPKFSNCDNFGSAVGSIGDLNGDGVTDLVVGANGDDNGGPPFDFDGSYYAGNSLPLNRGAVHVLFLNGLPGTPQRPALESITRLHPEDNIPPVPDTRIDFTDIFNFNFYSPLPAPTPPLPINGTNADSLPCWATEATTSSGAKRAATSCWAGPVTIA